MSELKQYHDQTVYTGGLNCPTLRTSVVIASDAEAVLKEKDAEIARLKRLLSDCLDCFEHTPDRPIAVAIRRALEPQ